MVVTVSVSTTAALQLVGDTVVLVTTADDDDDENGCCSDRAGPGPTGVNDGPTGVLATTGVLGATGDGVGVCGDDNRTYFCDTVGVTGPR